MNYNFDLFGSLAYTERLPVLDELYDGRSGNLGLKAEQSLNYEGGRPPALSMRSWKKTGCRPSSPCFKMTSKT